MLHTYAGKNRYARAIGSYLRLPSAVSSGRTVLASARISRTAKYSAAGGLFAATSGAL